MWRLLCGCTPRAVVEGRRNAALVAASATTCHLPGFRTCCSRCHDSGGRRHSSRCMEVTRRLQRGDLGGQHAFEPRDTQASSGITTQAIVVDSSSDTAPDADAEADAANAAECLVSGEGTTKTAQGASCSDGDASFCGISGEEGGTGSDSVPRSYYPASLEGHNRLRHSAVEPILPLPALCQCQPLWCEEHDNRDCRICRGQCNSKCSASAACTGFF